MFTERICSHLGIRQEYPLNPLSLAFFAYKAEKYARKHKLLAEGSIPAYGAAIFVSNHIDTKDIYKTVYASLHLVEDYPEEPNKKRLVRVVAKSTLFGIPEPESIAARTGKKDILNSKNPLIRFIVARVVGELLYGIGAIPIVRSTLDRRAIRMIQNALDNSQLVGISIMETRDKTGGLKDIKEGPAFIIKRNPDTPFYLAGISKDPNYVKISEPFTYNQLRNDVGDFTLSELAMFLADGIADLLPEKNKQCWYQSPRQLEMARMQHA